MSTLPVALERHPSATRDSARSWAALNAANFFVADLVAVVLPFLSKFLAEKGWRDDAILYAAAVGGLGVFLAQLPAGAITDRIKDHRVALALASLVVGLCFAVLPLVPATLWVVNPLLFVGGVGQAFFVPLTGALALVIAGHAGLHRIMGENQGWNHAGNLTAAATAMVLAHFFGAPWVFYSVGLVSLMAAASALAIRAEDLHPDELKAEKEGETKGPWAMMGDRRVVVLFVAVALFHLANAPVMPLVGLYITRLGGTDLQLASVVFVAQVVMVPVAVLAGWLCHRWGRKPVFAIAFIVLPVRIALYGLTSDPWTLVMLQTLDGVGAGIYGVVIAVMCADLTKGTGGFNTLMGLMATALAVGGVLGPLLEGPIVQHLGFKPAFWAFAGVAAVGAVLFVTLMPETKETADNP